ncbi:ankyrin repeat-containing domain protein [Xylaria grammica]|nr:ankyrin repeat-containing domain protein [Xylaria grammica]
MWAEDIGGAIVKLALVIAAQETQYQWILNATQAVIFWGTPHRASLTHSLDSTVLALIEAYYTGLIGNWIPTIVNRLSRQLENIHDRFNPISHRFTLISYYQRPSSSKCSEVIVTEECATLGLEDEITIGCSRPHKDMSKFMSRQEQSILQTHIINSKIGHWERFKHCLNILESAYPKRQLDRPVLPRTTSKELTIRDNHDSTLTNWISSEKAPRYMRVELGDTADAFEILNSITWAMWMRPDVLWLARPSIHVRGAAEGLNENVWIYTSLLQQILAQQPRIFLNIEHLVPLLADAIRGCMKTWTERALWLCLRTVIHAPIEVPIYGFLHAKTQGSVDAILRIKSELQGADSMFKLVFSYTDSPPVGLEDLDCVDGGDESPVIEECPPSGTSIVPEAATIDTVGRDSSATLDTGAPVQHFGTTEDITVQLLTLRIQAMGRPIFIALTWIAFATRPLYADELELFLDFDHKTNSVGVGATTSHARSSGAHLLHILPDVVSSKGGKLFLQVSYDKLRGILQGLSQDYFTPALPLHLYIAQSCLSILVKYVFKAPESLEVATVTSPEHESSGLRRGSESDGDKSAQENKQPSTEPLDAQEASSHIQPTEKIPGKIATNQRTIAEYAAQNWLTHYELGGAGTNREVNDEAYRAFVDDKTNVQNWLALVENLSGPSPPTTGSHTSTSLEPLQKYLDITKIDGLKVLYRLANRPSSVSGVGRLLMDAAETGNESLIHSIPAELDSLPEESVLRALAATSGSVYDDLRKSCALFLAEQHPRRLAQAQLSAQVLGNEVTSKLLIKELLDLPASPDRDRWFSDALHRAIEYSDDALTELFINHHLQGSMGITDDPMWTIVHRAASRGSLSFLNRLWEVRPGYAVNTPSPDHRSPLFIASSYGFSEITESLIAKEAHVDGVNGDLERTALHIASDHGRLETVKVLLDHEANIAAADNKGNFPLHLAIHKAHIKIAEILAERFPDPSAARRAISYDSAATPRTDREMSVDVEDADRTAAENALDTNMHDQAEDQGPWLTLEDTGSALLDMANTDGINVLFAAATRELPTVGELLLDRGADPNILGDFSRVALHMAARGDSIDLVKRLLDKGAVVDHPMEGQLYIPLHYACYRGYADAAKVLANYGSLDLKDCWDHIALSAACSEGHLQVVKTILGYYDKKDYIEGLITAARFGHRDVMVYLLDMGCHVNATNVDGKTALAVAALSNRTRVAQLLLLRGANLASSSLADKGALHQAAKRGFSEMAGLLIEAGMEVDADNESGESPLSLAIYWEHRSTVRLLLEKGARMRVPERFNHYSNLFDFSCGLSSEPVTNILLEFYQQGRNEDGLTPAKALIAAMRRENPQLLDSILEKWLAPGNEIAMELVGDALHYAASQGRLRDLRVMLQNPLVKAAINYQSPTVGTPLHSAMYADENSGEMVEVLVSSGADVEIAAGRAGTPLNLACMKARLDVVEKLLATGPRNVDEPVTGRYGTPVQSTVVGFEKEKSETTIKMLGVLQHHGYALGARGGLYYTAFHAAAYHSTWEVIEWLRQQDSLRSIIELDKAGRFPMHLAIVRGDWAIVSNYFDEFDLGGMISALVGFGDYQLLIALHYAAISRSETVMEGIFAQLGDNDVAPLVASKDLDGWTPLHWACRQPNKKMVEMLIAKGADPEALTNESWTPRHIAILHGIEDPEYLAALPDIGRPGEGLPEGEGARFGETFCDICFLPVRWKFYHCTNEACVDDFDLCFKCYKHAESVHDKGHEFTCSSIDP